MKIDGTQAQQTNQTKERTVVNRENGQIISIMTYKDVNGDGKEDLYSISIRSDRLCYCNQDHYNTYIDKDGDGYFDQTQWDEYERGTDKINSHGTSNVKQVFKKNDATKMSNVGKSSENQPEKEVKGVKSEDVNTAKNLNAFKAVNLLMEKSPIGKKLPSDDELAEMGFPKQKYFTMNGDFFYGKDLTISTCFEFTNVPKGAKTKAVYKTGELEQIMYYDKDGNLLKGIFNIADKELNCNEESFTIWRGEDGKYNYMN